MKKVEWLAVFQGSYFLLTGIWPLLHISSFVWVTGPKTDIWLVKTVGILVGVVGAVLLSGGLRRRVTPEIAWLGAGCGAGLAAIDIYYFLDGTLRWVYLLDAFLEIGFIGAWFWGYWTANRPR